MIRGAFPCEEKPLLLPNAGKRPTKPAPPRDFAARAMRARPGNSNKRVPPRAHNPKRTTPPHRETGVERVEDPSRVVRAEP